MDGCLGQQMKAMIFNWASWQQLGKFQQEMEEMFPAGYAKWKDLDFQ